MKEITHHGLTFQIPLECFKEVQLMILQLNEEETILFHELWNKLEVMKDWSANGPVLIDGLKI